MHYPLYINPQDNCVSLEKTQNHVIEVIPKRPSGELGRWTWGSEKTRQNIGLLVGKAINRDGEADARDIFRID